MERQWYSGVWFTPTRPDCKWTTAVVAAASVCADVSPPAREVDAGVETRKGRDGSVAQIKETTRRAATAAPILWDWRG